MMNHKLGDISDLRAIIAPLTSSDFNATSGHTTSWTVMNHKFRHSVTLRPLLAFSHQVTLTQPVAIQHPGR